VESSAGGWLRELAVKRGEGKLFYLVFPDGANPGELMIYLCWMSGNLEAVSSLLLENGYFFSCTAYSAGRLLCLWEGQSLKTMFSVPL